MGLMAKTNPVLASLIAGKVGNPAQLGQDQEFQHIPLEQLVENERNDLFPIYDAELEDLLDSIHAAGLSEPLTVTPDGDKFRIVSGHRRCRAFRKLAEEYPEETQWKAAPCYIKKYATPEDEELALIMANTQVRKDKSWMVPAAQRIRSILAKKAEREGVKLRGKLQGEIAEMLQISRQDLQRQEYIAEHLEEAVRKRWANLPTQVANSVAHMSPNEQAELAKRWPDWMPPPSNADVLGISASSRLGNDWYAIQEKLHKEKLEEKQRKKQAEKEGGKKVRCAMEQGGGWIFEKKCTKGRGDECTAEYECCYGCPERYFCPNICEGVKQKQKSPSEQTAKGIAQRARAARLASGCLFGIHELETGNYPTYSIHNLLCDCADMCDCSTDYLLGMTEEPLAVDMLLEKLAPAATAPGWKKLDADHQPQEGTVIDTATWLDGRWIRGRMTWTRESHDYGFPVMWTESIPLPPPLKEDDTQENIY